ncbi:hypothetical protein [Rhizobium leguminosarum]|uniref:hypothetical protein n=1 Tax=Rhizobium leguminosarum TaxID=384 RepID=UPI00048272EB|nr:hypothetical protein [Rhizobium leguminosarum]
MTAVACVATIEKMISRVRLRGRADVGLAARMDSLARNHLRSHLSNFVTEAAAGDSRVVLIRKLKVSGRLTTGPNEQEVASAWARLLVEGILQAADRRDEPDDIRVFSGRAEWIAACACDLLARGTAASAWWYGPMLSLVERKPIDSAIVKLLEYDPAQSLAVLAAIDRRTALTRLLDLLSAGDRAKILSSLAGSTDRSPGIRDRLRPILTAALDVLNIDRVPASAEALLGEWMAYCGAVREPNWQDRSDLADAVLAACRFLMSGGHCDLTDIAIRATLPSWFDHERLRNGLAADGNAIEAAMHDKAANALKSALAEPVNDPDGLTLIALSRLAAADLDTANELRRSTLMQRAASLALRLNAYSAGERAALIRDYREGKGSLAVPDEDADLAMRASVARLLEKALAAGSIDTMASAEFMSSAAGVILLVRALTDLNLARALADVRPGSRSLPDHPALLAAALLNVWAGPCSAQSRDTHDVVFATLLGDHAPADIAEIASAVARVEASALDSLADRIDQMTTPMASSGASGDLADLRFPPAVSRIASRLFGHWARWLRGFERSSTPWLLEHAVRRSGRLIVVGEKLTVVLPPLPLDIALRRAGYLDTFAPPAWLPWRQIAFRIENERS